MKYFIMQDIGGLWLLDILFVIASYLAPLARLSFETLKGRIWTNRIKINRPS